MKRKNSIIASLDWFTIILVTAMAFLGWINIYAASFTEDNAGLLDLSQRYGKQLLWIGFAAFIAIIVLIIDSKFYDAFSYPIYGVMLILLLSVLVIGTEVKGAKSWISLGSFRLQPAEFMKFATSLALAKTLSKFNFSFNNLKDFTLSFIIVFTPAAFILLQNDTGSALVYAALILAMFREGLSSYFLIIALLGAAYFIGVLMLGTFAVLAFIFIIPAIAMLFHKEWRLALHWGIATIIGITIYFAGKLIFPLTPSTVAIATITGYSIFLIIQGLLSKLRNQLIWVPFLLLSLGYTLSTNYVFNNVLGEHQSNRIQVLLGLKSDPLGVEYNVIQSKIAIGSGGVTGKGFLNGTQTKFDFVPEQATDFIFCTVGEEWGFLGTSLVIILFVVFFLRLIFLAERQRSPFSRIYGYSVLSIFFFHFAINIGMTIGLVPVIGIPLPFFSYGGSSLWGFTFLLFIFLRLDANRKEVLS